MKLLVLLLVLPALLFGGTPRDYQIASVKALNSRDVKAYVAGYADLTPAKRKAAFYSHVQLWKDYPKVHTTFLDCTVIMDPGGQVAHVLGAVLTINGPKPSNVWVYEETLVLRDGKWLCHSIGARDYLDVTKMSWPDIIKYMLSKHGLDVDHI